MYSLKIFFCLFFVQYSMSAQLKLKEVITGSRTEFGNRIVLSDDGNTLLITSENYNIQNDVFRLYIYRKTLNGWVKLDSIVNLGLSDLLYGPMDISYDGTIIATNRYTNALKQYISLFKYSGSKFDSIYTIENSQSTQSSFATCLKLSNNGEKLISNYLDLNLINTYLKNNNSGIYNKINTTQKPFSSNIFGRTIDMSGDGLFMVASNLAQYFPYVSGDIEFYHWQNNKWILHSNIPNEEQVQFFGNRVILSDDGQKCFFGITKDSAEIIRSYIRIGQEWIQCGDDIVLDHCELLDYHTVGTVLDVSADGKIICVSASYCKNRNNRFKIFRYLNDNWTEIKLPPYDNIKYAPSNSANISNDGKTIVVGFSKISTNVKIPDYVAVYSLDNSVDTKEEHSIELKIHPNPTNNLIHIQGLQEEAKVSIKNINGQIVKTVTTTDGQIDISDIPNGLYIFAIQNKYVKERHKVVKVE